MKVADDLASAMEVRGVSAPFKRTSLYDYKVGKADVIFIIIVSALLVAIFILDSSYFSFLDIQLFWGYMF
ncbi:MAG: hypothetical protein QXO71_05555 [Candidatus Jordarchaeaceae archaeon]